MKKYWTGVLLLFILCWFMNGNAEAGNLDFAVIQPGQPGTEAEARPVMDALARYIQQKMGSGETLKGVYFNQLEPAVAFLKASPPAWGITQLGVYVQHGKEFQMTPVAATRPGGFEKDVWYLMTRKDGPPKWQSLKGEIQGNMLFEKRAAACLLFELPANQLPFVLEGTFRPLRSSRSAAKGKITGVVLDRVQYETVKTLSVGEKIKVEKTSRDLPTSPVVWFGPVNDMARKLAGVLQGMKEDANAAKLLTLLQTDGFGPADPDLPQFRLSEKADVCFTP
jgi:hypothetical protein